MFDRTLRSPIPLALAAALGLGGVSSAQTVAYEPGFAEVDSRVLSFELDPCGFVGATASPAHATLADGRVLQFTGLDFLLLSADGSLVANLGTLPGPVFPSFVELSPDETFAVVGESCNGDVFKVDLAGGYTTLATLAFNFDASFTANPDVVFVSAVGDGVSGRNRIYRIDTATGITTLRGKVGGFSGPLTFDASGNLYYATQTSPVDMIRWSAATLSSGALLTEANATQVATGLPSASTLVYDAVGDLLVVGEFKALRLFTTGGEERGTIVTTDEDFTFLGDVEVLHDGGTGSLQAFQPGGSRLRYTVTDFFSFAERREVDPRRPQATLTGPTTGPAAKTLTITGAFPAARVQFYFNDVSFLNPAEFVLGGDFPFHTALMPNRARRIGAPRATDADGTATFTYDDPGTLHGTLVFQAAIFDDAGALIGTSTYELN